MPLIGGTVGYRLLRGMYPAGRNVRMPVSESLSDDRRDRILERYFGPGLYTELAGKTVLDFGCGTGYNCIELAQRGCRHVIGLDIQQRLLDYAQAEADRLGFGHCIQFLSHYEGKVDVVISTNSFEHFADPAGILHRMRTMLRDDGYALIGFGYTWYHPLGGHLFSVFPWAHLIFSEQSLLRWRSEFTTDGATRFEEVEGGLNQITIHRWEKILAQSDFLVEWQRLTPIRAARRLHNRLTREFLTSTIQAKLIPK